MHNAYAYPLPKYRNTPYQQYYNYCFIIEIIDNYYTFTHIIKHCISYCIFGEKTTIYDR